MRSVAPLVYINKHGRNLLQKLNSKIDLKKFEQTFIRYHDDAFQLYQLYGGVIMQDNSSIFPRL